MLITTLGIGASFCSAPYDYSGLIIDRKIMIDAVPQCDVALRKLGLNADNLETLLITHFHADHLLGFPLLIPGRNIEKPLPVFGPAGTAKKMLQLCESVGREDKLERAHFIALSIDEPGSFESRSYHFTYSPMMHRPESIAYSISDPDGKKLVVSGDTAWNDNLAQMLTSADMAVLDMTYLLEGNFDHMILEIDLPKILRTVKPDCTVIFTHLGSAREEYLTTLDNLAAQLDSGLVSKLENIIVAEELKDYEI